MNNLNNYCTTLRSAQLQLIARWDVHTVCVCTYTLLISHTRLLSYCTTFRFVSFFFCKCDEIRHYHILYYTRQVCFTIISNVAMDRAAEHWWCVLFEQFHFLSSKNIHKTGRPCGREPVRIEYILLFIHLLWLNCFGSFYRPEYCNTNEWHIEQLLLLKTITRIFNSIISNNIAINTTR